MTHIKGNRQRLCTNECLLINSSNNVVGLLVMSSMLNIKT